MDGREEEEGRLDELVLYSEERRVGYFYKVSLRRLPFCLHTVLALILSSLATGVSQMPNQELTDLHRIEHDCLVYCRFVTSKHSPRSITSAIPAYSADAGA